MKSFIDLIIRMNTETPNNPDSELDAWVPPPASKPWWKRSAGHYPGRTWYRIVCLATLTVVTFKLVLLPIRITGHSMFPTYRDGQINYANRMSYLWSRPQRGDIVVIKTTGEKVTVLKRLLGLPGERIRMRNGKVFINGELQEEAYIRQEGGWRSREILLGPDEYWAIGDNRAISEFGKVHLSRLVGKILF